MSSTANWTHPSSPHPEVNYLSKNSLNMQRCRYMTPLRRRIASPVVRHQRRRSTFCLRNILQMNSHLQGSNPTSLKVIRVSSILYENMRQTSVRCRIYTEAVEQDNEMEETNCTDDGKWVIWTIKWMVIVGNKWPQWWCRLHRNIIDLRYTFLSWESGGIRWNAMQLHIFSARIWSLTLDLPLTLNKKEQEQLVWLWQCCFSFL